LEELINLSEWNPLELLRNLLIRYVFRKELFSGYYGHLKSLVVLYTIMVTKKAIVIKKEDE